MIASGLFKRQQTKDPKPQSARQVVRHLTFSEARKQPVQEYSLPKVQPSANPETILRPALRGGTLGDMNPLTP